MKKYFMFIVVALFFVFQTFTFAASTENLVGGDSDEHGCKASAGYSWNETYGACLRSWEVESGVYASSVDFLAAQGKTCSTATDGCNTIQIRNGELGASTMMYCENVYGTSGEYKWSCLDTSHSGSTNTDSGIYHDSKSFLQSNEGKTCSVATDGCNTVHISNGQLGAMTEMYCEDIYGENGQENWSCLDEALEQKEIGFLSTNDKNYYKTLRDTTLGETISDKINDILENYSSKILEVSEHSVINAIKKMDQIIATFQTKIEKLSLSYPADTRMSKLDSIKYSVLQYAQFQLQIIENRWKQNSGLENTITVLTDSKGNNLEMNFDNVYDRVQVRYNSGASIELYSQKPASGIWYKNDIYELRGKGEEVEFTKNAEVIFKNY